LNTQGCADKRTHKRKRRVKKDFKCSLCTSTPPFAWRCRGCGFTLCQECMNENIWGLSCNGITWFCPECETMNDLGNQ